MSNKVERRTVPCEFRVSDSGAPVIFGYAAKFGVRSDDLGGWREIIAGDAFDAHLALNPDVRGLINHDPNLILGRTAANTMRITRDEVGIAYEIDPPDTSAARDLLVSMRRGDITQSSFAFICRDAAWSYDEAAGVDIRTVKQAELYDCSPVTYPAYPQATSGVRSFPDDMPREIRTRLTKRANDSGCECDCPECSANDCANCSNDNCADVSCSHARAARDAAALETLSLRVKLARAKARAS